MRDSCRTKLRNVLANTIQNSHAFFCHSCSFVWMTTNESMRVADVMDLCNPLLVTINPRA